MSLLVHLPLNDNLENKGLSDITVINNGATVDDDGKIGKCYSFNGSSNNITVAEAIPTLTFSICTWFKLNSTNLNHCIATCRNKTDGGIALFEMVGGKLRFDIGSVGTEIVVDTVVTNTWYHIVATYDGNVKKIYLNGNLLQSEAKALTEIANISTKGWSIGASQQRNVLSGSNNYLNGYLNDVRIYDHCLSPKEVKEISKGLVLHYKLDDIYNSSTLQNKYSGNSFLGDASYYPAFVKTKLSDEVGYNYKLNYTGTGSNKLFYLRFPEFEFTPDTMHQYSVYVRCNSKENINNLDFRAARIPNDYHTGLVSINTITNTDNEWHRYELSLIIPTSHVYSGTTYESHPLIELVTDNLNGNGTLYSLDIDLKFIQVVENSEKVPVIDNTLFTNKVYDSSVYNNNGTIIGTLTVNNDSPKYNYSTIFDGNISGILIENLNISNIINTALTYSFWIKPNGENGTMSVYFSSYYGTSFSIEKNANNKLRLWWNGSPDLVTDLNIIDGQWLHIVITKEGTTTMKVYLNGVLIQTLSNTYNNTTFPTTFRIGRDTRSGDGTPYKGQMSDFRIYATALSAEDVKELYDTAAYITNEGDMCAYEFVEDETSPTIEKTGIVKVDNLYENGTEITLDEELTRFGLDYITSENFNEI